MEDSGPLQALSSVSEISKNRTKLPRRKVNSPSLPPEPVVLPSPTEVVSPTMAKYTPWGLSQRILAKQRFVDYDLLLDFINAHRFIQFNVKANRDRIRATYYALPTAAPFSSTVQFPDDKLYVHLDNGSIDSWLTQLLHALDLPDRAMEKSTGTFIDSADA